MIVLPKFQYFIRINELISVSSEMKPMCDTNYYKMHDILIY